MGTLELNVTSILVGVLIARIIIIWVLTFRLYVESTVDLDQDESEKDYHNFERELVSCILNTAITGVVIIIIVEIYINYQNSTYSK